MHSQLRVEWRIINRLQTCSRSVVIDTPLMEREISQERLTAARAYLRMRFPAMGGFPIGQLPRAETCRQAFPCALEQKPVSAPQRVLPQTSTQLPDPGDTEAEQMSCAVPCFVPEDAVMTTGPPTLTHVASPVLGSTVAHAPKLH
jgi:hypothetical protein